MKLLQQNKAFTGLVAPPVLDVIWMLLIPTEIYHRFCDSVFKMHVDRINPADANTDHNLQYDFTISLLYEYQDIIYPFYNLWPNRSKTSIEEQKAVVFITK